SFLLTRARPRTARPYSPPASLSREAVTPARRSRQPSHLPRPRCAAESGAVATCFRVTGSRNGIDRPPNSPRTSLLLSVRPSKKLSSATNNFENCHSRNVCFPPHDFGLTEGLLLLPE